MTYLEKAADVAGASSIAVQVLLGAAPADIEFVPIRPRPADAQMLADLKSRWPGRGLRSIGIVGLVGLTARAAFKEPLEPKTVDALATAFLVYVAALTTPAPVPIKLCMDGTMTAEEMRSLLGRDTRTELWN